MATAALVLGLILGDHTAADVVLALFVVAAGLESIFAICLGCQVFGLLMRVGLVPARCARSAPTSASASAPRPDRRRRHADLHNATIGRDPSRGAHAPHAPCAEVTPNRLECRVMQVARHAPPPATAHDPYDSPSAAPRRMSCSETSNSLKPEQRQRLEQDDHAGDDRRRAIGVQPAHLPALVQSQPRQPIEDPPAFSVGDHVALDLVRVVGLELLGDRGHRRRGPRDPDRPRHRPPAVLRAPRRRTRPGRRAPAPRARRLPADRSGGGARSGGRRRPGWRRGRSPRGRCRSRTRSSRRRCRSRPSASGRRGRARWWRRGT